MVVPATLLTQQTAEGRQGRIAEGRGREGDLGRIRGREGTILAHAQTLCEKGECAGLPGQLVPHRRMAPAPPFRGR